MADSIKAHLSATPWCHHLISSEQWVPAETASRKPKPTGEDSFFAETLSTPRTIRAMLTLRPTAELDNADVFGDMVYGEVRTIMELGNGLDGHPRVAHGGFATTLLDEVMGVLITLNSEAIVTKKRERGLPGPHQPMTCFTAYLNTIYKKPLPTPGLVLCSARLDRVVRNKIYVSATLENGSGTVFTAGEGMFVSVTKEQRDGKL